MVMPLRQDDEFADLDEVIAEAQSALAAHQCADGHWIWEFEPDATISAEYIFLHHFLGEIDDPAYREREAKIANFLRSIQGEDGGWPLFEQGEADISASVKAYYALKLAGDRPEAPHMTRARELILAKGGAANVNVFTRIALALFDQAPWRAVPVMPVEIMHLPRWFPFHLTKVSYWSRTVIVPLLVIMALKPRAKNPRGIGIGELFTTSPAEARYDMNPTGTTLGAVFAGIDRVLRSVEPLIPQATRNRAIGTAMDFIKPRLNGIDGLGGIFPAMANAVMAFEALGTPRGDPDFVMARKAIDNLLFDRGSNMIYCQPCLSPVWDTCLATHAMLEAGEDPAGPVIGKAVEWMVDHEITEVVGDWAVRRPNLKPAGWAFQYRNDYYADVDDTAVVVLALDRARDQRAEAAIKRAADWVIGMQSTDGGWGAFEPENTHYHLNYIPFADHGALLDPPTVDVTARCLAMLAQLGYRPDHLAVAKAVEYLKREQEADGSWYGRWGVNYIYGTWSALSALNAAGEDMSQPYIQRAVAYLKSFQQADGGWGEDCATYWKSRRGEVKASTPSQTAWALLGLMAAGEVESEAVERGIEWLKDAPRTGPRWDEALWTGVGFPRVFYIKYHGYAAYFPLWALARYRNLVKSNERRVRVGM